MIVKENGVESKEESISTDIYRELDRVGDLITRKSKRIVDEVNIKKSLHGGNFYIVEVTTDSCHQAAY